MYVITIMDAGISQAWCRRLCLLIWCLGLLPSHADTYVSANFSPLPGGTNYNCFVSMNVATNAANGVGQTIQLPLLDVLYNQQSVPFTRIVQTPTLEIDAFSLDVPASVITNSAAFVWSNQTNFIPVISTPVFQNFPNSQSAFVGSVVIFSAPAAHTTGYQWQKNGTNLVAGSHYPSVTNFSLVITNAQLTDAGTYTVIASHPINNSTFDVMLSVYKPLQLGLEGPTANGNFTLTIANQDRSPFESARAANLQVFTSTNLSVDFSSWNLETNLGSLTNGVWQIPYPPDGSTQKYWRTVEQ